MSPSITPLSSREGSTRPPEGPRTPLCTRSLPLRDVSVERIFALLPTALAAILEILRPDERLRMALFRHDPEGTAPWLQLAVLAPEKQETRARGLDRSLKHALRYALAGPGVDIRDDIHLSLDPQKAVRISPASAPERVIGGMRLVDTAGSRRSGDVTAYASLADRRRRMMGLPAQLVQAVSHLDDLPQDTVIVLEMGQRFLNAADNRAIDERIAAYREEDATALTREALDHLPPAIAFLRRLRESGRGFFLCCAVYASKPANEVALEHLSQGIFGAPHAANDNFRPEAFLWPDEWFEQHALVSATALTVLWQKYAPLSRLVENGVCLGSTREGLDVYLSNRDRARHTYIIGATGTGKSTLLANMILQDMEAGRGVILFDPHGDLWEAVRRRVPAARREDVQLCHLGDGRWPFTCNLLEGEGGDARIERNMIANNLITLFRTVLYRNVQEAFGPLFEYTFRAALLLLMSARGAQATLMDFEKIFSDKEFRRTLLRECRDAQVKNNWKILERISATDWQLDNLAPYIVSKLTQITGNPLLRPILASRESSLKFSEIIRGGGICLVNLAEGLVGEKDASFAGGVLSIRLAMAARAGALLPEKERGECFVYMDEFQNYATQSLADMVAGLRKYGIRLTLANQTLAQLEAGLDHADLVHHILGNVANVLAFRVGQKDAQTLQAWFPETAVPLTDIADHHLLARILEDGITRPPALLRTPLPPAEPTEWIPDPEPVPFPSFEVEEAANDDEPAEQEEDDERNSLNDLFRVLFDDERNDDDEGVNDKKISP